MDNDKCKAVIRKFGSLESLNTDTNTVLTSTKNPIPVSTNLINVYRRRAIVPTPNRPTIKSKMNVMSNKIEDPLKVIQRSDDTAIPTIMKNKQEEIITCSNQSSPSEKNEDEQGFDIFIMDNFTPFSGKQNVEQWLDETEQVFAQFKIPRDLRYKSISLLVTGIARRIYIDNRQAIQSFDDFYELILTHFGRKESTASQSKPANDIPNTLNQQSLYPIVSHVNNTNTLQQPSAFRSTTFVDLGISNSVNEIPPCKSTNNSSNLGITNNIGGGPACKSDNNSNNNNNSMDLLDQTTMELRKAIVADLIKNPKVFKGGQDDVRKWIEDIEHLLDVTHIPDTSRLDLITYLLRGDALQWYKNNKYSFTSWKTFILELRRTFTSSFHEELAFKQLEAYSQGEYQSVRNFFNETLKLCKEADSTMSEATKLKNLLNKAKPSIQFEVRKKKPTTTAEFLEYAKDIEELFQLSNVTTNDIKNKNSQNSNEGQSSSLPIESYPGNKYLNNTFPNRVMSGYSGNTNPNKNVNTFMNRNTRNHQPNPTPALPSFRVNQPYQNQSRTNSQQFSSNRNNSSFNTDYPGRNRYQTSQSNSYNNNPSYQRSANTIHPSTSSTNINVEPEIHATDSYKSDSQLEHEDSSSPNFQ
jgi:hypothetical protein